MEWITTSTVLVRLGASDNAAWDCFIARFRRPIIAFARRMGFSEFDAEDVAQETLLAFAQQFRDGQYDPAKGRLGKWLFGIAFRQAQNRRRHEARVAARGTTVESGVLTDLADEAAATKTWDEEWERSILEQCLHKVRGEVDESTYQAFELIVHHEKSAQEAANALQCPIKHVYNAKHRILKRVRELRAEFEETA